MDMPAFLKTRNKLGCIKAQLRTTDIYNKKNLPVTHTENNRKLLTYWFKAAQVKDSILSMIQLIDRKENLVKNRNYFTI